VAILYHAVAVRNVVHSDIGDLGFDCQRHSNISGDASPGRWDGTVTLGTDLACNELIGAVSIPYYAY